MKLGNLIEIINGYPFESSNFNLNNSGYPVIKIKELKKNKIQLTKDTCFTPVSESLSQYVVRKDDILVALTGNPPTKGGIDAMVGRCSKYNLSMPAYLNQRVCKVLSISKNLIGNYLFYFLSLEKTIRSLAAKCSGSANQANISSDDIKNLEIILPEVSVQQHIVNTISILFLKFL